MAGFVLVTSQAHPEFMFLLGAKFLPVVLASQPTNVSRKIISLARIDSEAAHCLGTVHFRLKLLFVHWPAPPLRETLPAS